MVGIERVDHAFADVRATDVEWSRLEAIVRHAVEAYDSTQLDYLIPGAPEERFGSVRSLSELFASPRPDESPFHMADLRVLFLVVAESERLDNPYISMEAAEEIRDALSQFRVDELFAGEWSEG